MSKTESDVQMKFEELLKSSNYNFSDKEIENLKEALHIATEISCDDTDLPDYSKVIYNLEIGIIAMKEIGLGPVSVICSLLHNTLFQKQYSCEFIGDKFGEHVVDILKGFRSISEMSTERVSFQSDRFRTMFLSVVDDIRVILIRLAHRLQDMRHISDLGDKRDKFVDEVKHLYSPIAHRLGLYRVKAEFEEMVMKYEQPDIYYNIANKIKETKSKREVYIREFIDPIEKELIKNGFDFDIKWRTKSVPSIWSKMLRQNVPFEEVYDLFAIRIIINTKLKNEKEDCWKVYSHVTNIYAPNPKRLRDWISTPKASGYESLHTTVVGPGKKCIEVQIRTARMDDDAEKGRAAHWQYKGIMRKKDTEDWLSQVRDILENPDQINIDDSYKTSKEHKNRNVFVFTPKGDLKQLPGGSTVLDFAFGIHSDVGASCKGARINDKVVPIRYVLQNGDKVNIITSKKQKPKLDWLSFVTTDKAKTRIKRQLKEEKYIEADTGKSLLLRKLKNWKIKSNEDIINFLVKHYKLEAAIDLYYLIATEKIELQGLKKLLQDFTESETVGKTREGEAKIEEYTEVITEEEKGDTLYIGNSLKNIDYRMAKCCNPIPGDKVFGFITTTGGITVHRVKCPNAPRLKAKYPYRIMEVKWTAESEGVFSNANLRITGRDELGIVGAITKVITDDLRVNMRSVSFQTSGKKFVGKVSVSIKDHDHLLQLIAKLTKVKGVEKVVRGK